MPPTPAGPPRAGAHLGSYAAAVLERLARPEVRVRLWERAERTPVRPGVLGVGPLEVRLGGDATTLTWTITNGGAEPVSVVSVAVAGALAPFREPVPVYCDGWQSWSWVRTARLGVDEDPSRAGDGFALLRGGLHADPEVCAPGELRSENVVLVAPAGAAREVFGFAGGSEHDGTFRLRVAEDQVELAIEAYLGGCVLAPGEARVLHPVRRFEGDDAEALLAAWAGWAGGQNLARTGAPLPTGWCTWYHYFGEVTEADVRANLARIDDWPLAVFQVDDGYQRAIGDWLVTDPTFPSPLESLAADIAATGRQPGIWWAPFLVAPDSEVARAHPEWLARMGEGDEPLIGMINDAWGGIVWALDPTIPEVAEHIRATAAALRDAGFSYQKLDFTYAPALPGRFADASRTPAQRVRAAYEAVRAGAGDDAFLLGCGAPLMPCVGVVDGMRIGPDVAPTWHWRPTPGEISFPGYRWTEPATEHAWNSTLLRAYQHRRLWVNDPDCVMLRTTDTALAPDEARAWAAAAGVSGGMIVVSDDLAQLGADARRLLDDAVAWARATDDDVRAGALVRCEDRLDAAVPTVLRGGGRTLRVGDVDAPVATIAPVSS